MGVTMADMKSQIEHARDLFVALVFQTEQVIARVQGFEHSTSQFLKIHEKATSTDLAVLCA
jgi:hypothetical protein